MIALSQGGQNKTRQIKCNPIFPKQVDILAFSYSINILYSIILILLIILFSNGEEI